MDGYTRREFLKACTCLGAAGALGWLLTGCGEEAGPGEPDPTGTHVVDLADHPALAADQSVAVVSGTPAGSIFVTHTTGDSYFALSRRCTHQGCTVNATTPTLNCPCHGSKFNLNGAVAQGPAPRALTGWTVTREGSLLTVHFG